MSVKIDFGSDELFIKNYQELKSAEKVGKIYNCSKTAVLNHAKKIGFNVNSVKTTKLSDKDKQFILDNYNTMTSTELATKFNVSRGMITKVWYDADLKGKQRDYTNMSKNLLNQKFGYLTVIEKTDERSANGSVYWKCRCDCGRPNCLKIKKVMSSELLSGRTISCGAVGKENLIKGQGANFIDLTGQKFGKLTVLERIEDKIYNDNKYTQWKCQCECGRYTNVISDNLKSGNTQSCGFCSNNSHGNIKIEQLLKENNIPYIREKRFDSCRDSLPLPFDFFINNSYLIEYDGKQHFLQDSIYNSENTNKHDLIKNQWCKEHNIPLIRIPYTHYKDLCIEDLKLETSNFII